VQLLNTNGSAVSQPAILTVQRCHHGLTPASLTVFPGATASIYVSYSSAAPFSPSSVAERFDLEQCGRSQEQRVRIW